jgi:hypothetical protein
VFLWTTGRKRRFPEGRAGCGKSCPPERANAAVTAVVGLLFWLQPACEHHQATSESSRSELASASGAPRAEPPARRDLVQVDVPPSLERSCREICDRSRRLNCENVAKCMPNCLAMGSLTPCTEQISAFYRCLVGEPLQHWDCAPDGVAAIRNGFCDREQGATAACMEAKMQ